MKFTKINDTDFDSCDSGTVFVLDNGKDTFAVHLETMLACISFAAENGQLPPIPSQWLNDVANFCDKKLLAGKVVS